MWLLAERVDISACGQKEERACRVAGALFICDVLGLAADGGLDLAGKFFQGRHDVLVALGRNPTMQSLKKGIALCCGK